MTRTDLLPTELTLTSPEATARLAEAVAPLLEAGDVLLLSGPIGAGKSHFARAVIRWRMQRSGQVEDIPSPTYTLVQTYALTDGEIWHADLYRLTEPDEVEELGLTAAFDEAICLVEWPDRLPKPPTEALWIHFEPGSAESVRTLRLDGPAVWSERLAMLGDASHDR